MFVFKKFSRIPDIMQIKTVYYALVQSVLQYDIVVWGAARTTVIHPLEIIQKTIIKIIFSKPLLYPTDTLSLILPFCV